MYATMQANLIDLALNQPPHSEFYLSKNKLPHPIQMGFRQDLGEPVGQLADYRLALNDGKSIHIREYQKSWGIHWDLLDPLYSRIEHLRKDSPGYYVLACTTAGAGIGTVAGLATKKKNTFAAAVIVCTLLGLIIGLCTVEWRH